MHLSHPLGRAHDEVIAFVASGPSREQVAAFRLSDEAAPRTRESSLRNSAGSIPPAEADALDTCVQLVMVIRARARQQDQPQTA
jgi:hypothetical protein